MKEDERNGQNSKANNRKKRITKFIDSVVTHRFWGYPIFLLVMYAMFYCTFNVGSYPMDWIDSAVGWIADLVSQMLSDGALKDLLVDGIISGVGGVIVFLPNILILYAFISWMEDSGYMARAAFIMDKIMRRIGLHGRSFIPMIMGFGCSIPAIMATRTIGERKARLVTMLIVPLMSCSARLPVYIILIGAFFPHNSAMVLMLLYLIGVIFSVIMAKVLNKYIINGKSYPCEIELPPYSLPPLKAVVSNTWTKGRQYLKKMGTTILLASMAVWALSYYPHDDRLSRPEQVEHSYIGKLGKSIEPFISLCGMGWREGISIATGIGAKEIVASTMGVLYSNEQIDDDDDDDTARLSSAIAQSGMTPLSAFAFMVFVLLYFPCLPTCIAIRAESERWRWAIFAAIYTTVLAWLTSMIIYQVGMRIL